MKGTIIGYLAELPIICLFILKPESQKAKDHTPNELLHLFHSTPLSKPELYSNEESISSRLVRHLEGGISYLCSCTKILTSSLQQWLIK